MNILVAGASGTTGQLIVQLISKKGDTPIALLRNPNKEVAFPNNTTIREGDLEGDLKGVMDNIDAVFFAAGSGSSTGKDKTLTVDQEGAKKLIDRAKEAGIKRFVMLSSKGAEAPDEQPEGIQHYMHAKHNADLYLQASGLNYVIVRPVRLNNEPAIGKVEASDQVNGEGEITRADVANFMVHALYSDSTLNKVVELTQGDVPIAEAIRQFS
ncbi:MAG: SDR family oxidoreductase [Thermonemataceae bacterium]|mgnify:CR=1 FL=1